MQWHKHQAVPLLGPFWVLFLTPPTPTKRNNIHDISDISMQGVSRNMGIVFGTFKAPTTNLNWQNVCNCRSETLVQAVGSAGNWQGGKRTKTERERDDAEPFVESKNPQILNQLLLKCWLQSNSTTLVTRKHFPRSGERQQIFNTTWSDYVISWFDSIFPGSSCGDCVFSMWTLPSDMVDGRKVGEPIHRNIHLLGPSKGCHMDGKG